MTEGNHFNIHVGNPVEIMGAMPTASIDLLFATPPYGYDYIYSPDDDAPSPNEYLAWTREWLDAAIPLLKPTASGYIVAGDEYVSEIQVCLKHYQRQRQILIKNWIVWHYDAAQSMANRFGRSHAHLLYFVGSAAFDDESLITFNAPASYQNHDDSTLLSPPYSLPAKEQVEPEPFDPASDTWHIPRQRSTVQSRKSGNIWETPEDLLKRVIMTSTNRTDIVLDPFIGAGNTAIVCHALGRKWIGCESDLELANVARERLSRL